MSNGAGGEISEFLNPKSMLTPGFAGGSTLLITNALGNIFNIPLGYAALAISALFGLLILTATVPLWQRAVYYVLNTLIIFCVAMGSNTAAQKIGESRQEATTWLVISAAYAQNSVSAAQAEDIVKDVESITISPGLTADQKLQAIVKELDTAKTTGLLPESENRNQGFFRRWEF